MTKWISRLALLLACVPAMAAPITIGNPPPEFAIADSGNGNLLLCQFAELAQPATLKSLSFYVTTPGGQLYLGVYQTGASRALIATTAVFSAAAGWNTYPTLTAPLMQPGTYCLAYHPSSGVLGFVKQSTGQGARYYSRAFGPLPVTFSTNVSTTASQWSFYATLESVPPAPLNGTPSAPSVTLEKFGSMTLSWDWPYPDPVSEFRLYLGSGVSGCPGGPFVAVPPLPATPATVEHLPWDTQYMVQVSAFNGVDGECSNVVQGEAK